MNSLLHTCRRRYPRILPTYRPSVVARLTFPVITAGLLIQERTLSGRTQTEADKGKNNNNNNTATTTNKNDATAEAGIFDITKQWEEATKGKADFFRKLMSRQADNKEEDNKTTSPTNDPNQKRESPNVDNLFRQLSQVVTDALGEKDTQKAATTTRTTATSAENAQDMSQTLLKLLSTRGGSSTVEDIVAKARSMGDQGDVADKASLSEIFNVAQRSASELDQELTAFLGEDSLPVVHPSNLFYFVEHEDEKKNFSYKRRKHRFFPGVDVEEVDDLNGQLRLALLSYTDSLEEIRESLQHDFNHELIYCTMESEPGKPSHFVAIKKDQSSWSNSLEVILVVRGTKTITDVITDLLCDSDRYRGGFAHAGILESGQFLANKHEEMLRKLCEVSGKKKIKLTLIGHSLGAGAASIAGMELQQKDFIDVQVVGFGCPALLSKELAQEAESYITTVIADDDFCPRLSSATMMNAIIDIGSYNWIPYARRDIEDVVDQVQSFLPMVVTDGNKKRIMSILDETLPDPSSITNFEKRMEPLLFPPGKCIHFYRDGFGISGNVVPCTFFDELDISRRMIHDHLFHTGYQLIFLDLMRQHHNDHYFRFEVDETRV
jgi:hypothetical protein